MQRGILGGTFDPPHLAHLAAGEAAYRQLSLDIVTFMPAGLPWQKEGTGVSSASHRWEMTKLAIAAVDYFEADDREVQRSGATYTADTLESFPSDEKLTLILGADAAAGLGSWERYDEILERARVAVMRRPGVDDADVLTAVGPGIEWLDLPRLEMSGTELRHRAGAGMSLRFLVPEAVWRYVVENDLYAS